MASTLKGFSMSSMNIFYENQDESQGIKGIEIKCINCANIVHDKIEASYSIEKCYLNAVVIQYIFLSCMIISKI